MLGINAKQDEFNAAMGNTILPHLGDIINERKRLSLIYYDCLPKTLDAPSRHAARPGVQLRLLSCAV